MKRVLLGALAATAVVGACTRTAPPGVREQPHPPPTTFEQVPSSSVPLATTPTAPARTPTATVRDRGATPAPAPSLAPSTARGPAPSATAASPVPEQSSTARAAGQCTDRYSYAGDPRPWWEINAIGRQTGSCPAPQRR